MQFMIFSRNCRFLSNTSMKLTYTGILINLLVIFNITRLTKAKLPQELDEFLGVLFGTEECKIFLKLSY